MPETRKRPGIFIRLRPEQFAEAARLAEIANVTPGGFALEALFRHMRAVGSRNRPDWLDALRERREAKRKVRARTPRGRGIKSLGA